MGRKQEAPNGAPDVTNFGKHAVAYVTVAVTVVVVVAVVVGLRVLQQTQSLDELQSTRPPD